MASALWSFCLKRLEVELSSQEFNTWIRPLQVAEQDNAVELFAPNNFVLNWVQRTYAPRIAELLQRANHDQAVGLKWRIGSLKKKAAPAPAIVSTVAPQKAKSTKPQGKAAAAAPHLKLVQDNSRLNPKFTFDTFVSGQSNRLARAASQQAAETGEFNPLCIYGGVGLGKTHLMHAVGHDLRQRNPDTKLLCVSSERFVEDMVKAIQNKRVDDFKGYYRSADVLLIDDIQFLAGKARSQEEFFHTFNTLMDSHQRIILTSDRTPAQIEGLEDRLKSRLGAGLTVAIGKPELETRRAILHNKANQARWDLPEDVAHFIAENLESNIRELEGALHRLLASAKLLHEEITLDFSKEILKDLLDVCKAVQHTVTIQEIQKIVAEYYGLSVDALVSKRRQRAIVRPRQMAMMLIKEMTGHSLPAIGEAFGGRDRTTVLHSCKTINQLQNSDDQLRQDYLILQERLGL